MPRPAVNVAVRAARAAGQIILRYMNRLDSLEVVEKQRHDYVSEVDRMAEAEIIRELRRAYPRDAILGEESGMLGKSRTVWVIDPLDGTRNYISRTGPWSVCIALYEGDKPRVAVVHEPVANETFSAIDGGGAFLNGERITVSGGPPLAEALVGVSFQPNPATKERAGKVIRELLPVCGDIRRLPAALNLVYLAAGRLDGGLALDTNLWDIAAGALIAREAGVVLGGRGDDFTTDLTVGAAPALWPALSERVRAAA